MRLIAKKQRKPVLQSENTGFPELLRRWTISKTSNSSVTMTYWKRALMRAQLSSSTAVAKFSSISASTQSLTE